MATSGDVHRAAAEKSLAKKTNMLTSIFGFGSSSAIEEAAESFTKAGNAYKLSNDWQQSGEMFRRAAECYERLPDNLGDCINSTVEAGNSFKKGNKTEAIACYERAVAMYNDKGRFGQSAKYAKEIAELHESEGNSELAVQFYRQAAELFAHDNKKMSGTPCLLKVATITSTQDDFTTAADIYETIGRESLESRLGAYSAKGYFLQCLLCHLAANDIVAVKSKLDAFKNVDFTFGQCRECGFIESLAQAFDDFNAEDFSTACAEYDRISPLDPWKTSMLLKAKRGISAGAGEDDVDLT